VYVAYLTVATRTCPIEFNSYKSSKASKYYPHDMTRQVVKHFVHGFICTAGSVILLATILTRSMSEATGHRLRSHPNAHFFEVFSASWHVQFVAVLLDLLVVEIFYDRLLLIINSLALRHIRFSDQFPIPYRVHAHSACAAQFELWPKRWACVSRPLMLFSRFLHKR
jgi:hypothetical protein